MHSSLARTIVEKLEGAPELGGIIDDRSVLTTHRELIDLMMAAMVPAGRRDDYHAMAVEPFTMLPFYETPAWRSLGLSDAERMMESVNIPTDQMLFGKLMWAYEFLLEQSVAAINDSISMTLDEEEKRAQVMFPHFFEKFRTDGVDHSIYVGAELHEDGLFDELYLRNLRIWQLMTTCRIEWELARVKAEVSVPLQATHLILVQHQPLSIRFRVDEKRFDVDGAYDIRYEIVKKRIDKARVRGTREHVTQPGQLAIVYSTASEAAEYKRYVDFLQTKGYFDPGMDELELEDLPGISGLKALRVTIASKSEVDEPGPPDRPAAREIEKVLAAGQT